ncbi:MAG: metallophosphatase, partial [Calditrichia bacterium]|nr:metallophosphatase [Calditrichia bacterium]
MKIIKFISYMLVLFLLFNCKKNTSSSSNHEAEVTIAILYTNDEHGWMEPYENYGGAAGMMGLWKENEGYVEGGNFLILSGGDMWTGPAISTWFEGESMTDVMNAMHYDAAAVGNHEFDFGLDGIADRAQQANFPFLAANIRIEGTSDFPEYVAPYIIKNINNVKIGIVGLTTLRTPIINFPENVAGLDFISYESALNEIVPQMKSEGAEIIILIGHFGYYNMLSLIQLAKTLGICMIGGGH